MRGRREGGKKEENAFSSEREMTSDVLLPRDNEAFAKSEAR